MRQNNPRNTKDRDQAPAQINQKMGQRKNNHRKNKVTTKQKIRMSKAPETQPPTKR